MAEQTTDTTAPDTSLRAHMLAEAAAEQPAEAVAPVTPAEPETPEAEADSPKPDADLSEAGKTLRRNRRDERVKKLAAENAALNEQLRIRKTLREELARVAPEPPRPAGGPPAARPTVADPNDPEPLDTAFEDYGQFLTAHARWAARDEFRQQQAAAAARARRAQSEQRMQTHAQKLDAQQDAVREKFADADDVIETVLASVRDNPRAADVGAYLAESDIGGEIAYRLGKDADALKAVLTAPNAHAVARALARVEVAITSPKATPVTRAPAPPRHTVGSSATVPAVDTTKGVSFKDHLRVENEREREARAAGVRY